MKYSYRACSDSAPQRRLRSLPWLNHKVWLLPQAEWSDDRCVVRVTKVGAIRAHNIVPGLQALKEFGGDVALAAVMAELERIQLQRQGRSPVLRDRL